jgi:hypothetical protein
VALTRGDDQAERRGHQVTVLVEGHFREFLGDKRKAEAAVAQSRRQLPPQTADLLDAAIAHRHRSYRDAALLQLAFGVVSDAAMDHCTRQAGGRGAAGRLGTFLAEHHIAAVQDALQNVGKNTPNLCRGNFPDFDRLLRWASDAAIEARQAALRYAVAAVSLTARPVAPMPAIDRSKLTFVRVAKLFQALLGTPSQGIYQQFIVAAGLEAIIDEFDLGGPGGLRVDTRNVNASDVSGGVAGDIQIKRGNRTEETFEVTANPWVTKASKAARLVKEEDVPRAHIVAGVTDAEFAAIDEFEGGALDLSILDVNAFVRTMVAVMRKPARQGALIRLYELLDRVQRDVERTNEYVRLLQEHGLTAQPD